MSSSGSTGSEQASCWGRDGQLVRLSVDHFQGTIELSHLKWGLHRLVISGANCDGKLLGVVAGEETTCVETFTRGNDLVVFCESDKPQQFLQWQVYWRAVSPSTDLAFVDAIVSLQTPLLESFPTFATYSSLPATEVWCIALGDQPRRLNLAQVGAKAQAALHCVVLRDERWQWSYVEMTDPADDVETTLSTDVQSGVALCRKAGGKFLEKGVIRRTRIRGVLLPRENDLERTAKLFAAYHKEEPPLTA